ncbi:efflux RND transporter periplasmic adaptor subunit [Salinibacterium hongtaonis]|nr:efflux RND transporter periplasmic adaptor subunit [Salinibacterium hongtaonis]
MAPVLTGGARVGVWRKWIFPSLRLVVFAAIAVALVKLAFFGGQADAPDVDVPSASMMSPQVPVALGTIKNDVVLTGTVSADEAVAVRSTAPGVVRKVSVTVGAWVDAGAEMFVIREDVIRDDGTTWARDLKVVAPAAGTVSTVAVIVGQAAAIGDSIAKIAPPSFHVSATLLPEQQYRLLNQPTDALVSVTGGPASFTCTGVRITTALEGAEGAEGSGTTLRCAVPADVTVFSGLSAKVTISGGAAENVLTVPITAVEGTSGTGIVHFVTADGATEPRTVTLGLNDGLSVEVMTGLAEGDVVLEFVPGAAALGDCDPDSGMECS